MLIAFRDLLSVFPSDMVKINKKNIRNFIYKLFLFLREHFVNKFTISRILESSELFDSQLLGPVIIIFQKLSLTQKLFLSQKSFLSLILIHLENIFCPENVSLILIHEPYTNEPYTKEGV